MKTHQRDRRSTALASRSTARQLQPKVADFAPFALTASAVALQLALGVPVLVGAYSRSAYAAVVSNCTYTPSGNIGGNTLIDCSIGSGTTGDAQLLYSGVNIWQTARNISFAGLAMNVQNAATINLSGTLTNQVMAPYNIPGQHQVRKAASLGALYAASIGSNNSNSQSVKDVAGGAGGALNLKNYGSIDAGNDGYGIVVYSAGGQGSECNSGDCAGPGGAAGGVGVGLYGTNSIRAGSRGGPAVYAASLGGNAGGSGDDAQGGQGGVVLMTLSGTQTISSQGVGPVLPPNNGYTGGSGGPQSAGTTRGGGIVGLSRSGLSAFKSNGSDSGAVILNGSGSATVTTQGSYSPGIYLLSEGGIAENSGYTGGTAGTVSVGAANAYLAARITTAGDYSPGLVAISLGGPGNVGKNNNGKTSGAANGGESSAVAVYVGSGGAIQTSGSQSHGIVAQSLGAGGGTYVTTASTLGDQNTSSASGDSVKVYNQARIAVSGSDSHGILAQSIGGGGGSIYSSNAGSTTLGGKGGKVTGNAVTVHNAGAITTGQSDPDAPSGSTPPGPYQAASGTGAIGILAQSIGGGGANALSKGILSVGGAGSAAATGGNGSNGGTVAVVNSAALTTYGYDAHSVLVQSIGGGGGNGRNKTGLFAAVGGAGGYGGSGGAASARNQGGHLALYGDYADGLFVQSIGGGGGNGGKATAWGLLVSVAHGGAGGAGGAGGSAYAYAAAYAHTGGATSSDIRTQGHKSSGIVVQSIGGGGGAGGSAKGTSAGVGLAVSVAFGGSGGQGGTGDSARAKVTGNVTTYGYDAIGVIAQSVGGGGGNGGGSSAKSFAADVPIPETTTSVGAAVSIATGGSGGTGGGGGDAYAVNLNSATTQLLRDAVTSSNGIIPGTTNGNTIAAGTAVSGITTFGDGATGMLVQSIGGGGGNGGDATAVSSAGVLKEKLDKLNQLAGGDSADDDGETTVNLTVGVSHGGSGANGGDGGGAGGINQGQIATYGMLADAMVVQSIGGGGGNGGAGNSKTNGAGTAVSLSIALGASGGGGGDGGGAYAGNAIGASIRTSGNDSRGILVQSIGGGGGNAGGGAGSSGGSLGVTIGLGHSGSGGGWGRSVFAYNDGAVVTSGDWSDGILAQSIGGGGGNAGAGDSSLTVPAAAAFSSAFPADDSSSEPGTAVDDGPGTDADPPKPNTFTLALGATGGYGGDGGNVLLGFATPKSPFQPPRTLDAGTVVTSGTLSHGLLAQSIGGGGGNAAVSPGSSDATANLALGAAGGAGGDGGKVQVYAYNVTTSGFSSHGVVAQSIGGGGGTGVASGVSGSINTQLGSKAISVSGSTPQGGFGSGGYVYVNSFGTIVTGKSQGGVNATDGIGILAQSIGGGGGLAAAAQGNVGAASGQGADNSISITLGGESLTAASSGGLVSVDHGGQITTNGARGFGIVAQSIGGGGGLMSAAAATLKAVTFNTGWGNGGPVVVELGAGAGITTAGAGAIGVLAQSVGGGGGFAADASQGFFPVSGTTGGANGQGGPVAVRTASGSAITTNGYNAHGIFAQSVGGGGGVWDNGSGTSAGSLQGPDATAKVGQIAVTVGGDIAVSGASAWGIWAQSAGAYAGANPITVTIDAGASVSGSGSDGGAIWAKSQGSNLITNNGTLTGSVQNSNHAVTAAPTPWDSVNQRLAAIDSVPQTGSQFINNGTFNSGAFVSGVTLTNNGRLNIGGTGQFQTTRFDHHLVGSGRVLMDVDMQGGRADQIDVVGAITPGPDGPMRITLNATSVKPGAAPALIRAGALDDGALAFDAPLSFDLGLSAPATTGGWHRLAITPNFTKRLGSDAPNLRNVAGHLNQAWNQAAGGGYDSGASWGGGPSMDDLFTLFWHQTDPGAVAGQLGQLLSSSLLNHLAATPADAVAMAGDAMVCPSFDASGTLMREQECVWADVSTSQANQDDADAMRGYRRNATTLSAGGQLRLAADWFLGLSLAYQDADYASNDGAERLDTSTGALALALKYQREHWYVAAALGGGRSWGDATRLIELGSVPLSASASPSTSYLFAQVRAAYEFTAERYYLRPLLDLDLIHLRQDSYRESGAGALSLAVDSADETLFAATPAVEVGGRIDRDDLTIRPFASVGLSLLSRDSLSAQARLLGAPGTPGFSIEQSMPDVVGRLRVGADVQHRKGLGLKLQYGLDLADGFDNQSGWLELSYRF